jgi:uncharacterized membrane protein
MAQWHCSIKGQKYGPVEEDELKRWIAEGRLTVLDLVWTEGMAEWKTVSDVPALAGLCAPPVQAGSPVPPLPAGSAGAALAPPTTGGTGGQTPNAGITAQARDALRGKWGLPIGFCLLFSLLSMAINNFPYIGGIMSLLLTGPLQVGSAIFFLKLIRNGQPRLGNMFDGFKIFGPALAAYLLMVLFVFLWMLLLIIPGIIAALAYAQTMYLLADTPGLGPMEAIRRSKKMMNGYKWKLFCLGLRFFCWSLLCLLTLGIGYLWLIPYASTAYAKFYEDLQPPLQSSSTEIIR